MSTLIDEVDPSQKVDIILFKELLFGEDSPISDREQKVIYARYWDKLTLKATGELYNVTQERIRQLQMKAERKLRCRLGKIDPSYEEFFMKIHEKADNLTQKEKQKLDKEAAETLFEQRRKEAEELRDKERLKRLDEQAEVEKELPCPDYMLLVRVDGEYALEIPIEELEGFVPITKPTYDRWLKEKIDETLK